jgi:hypothetical protein
MNVSKHEASEALDIVGEADARLRTLDRYARMAPLLFIWGTIWFVANAIADFTPDRSEAAWRVGGTAGVIASAFVVLGLLRPRGSPAWNSKTRRGAVARRFVMLAVAMGVFFPAIFVVLRPLTERQENAFITLCWAFLYMFVGAWFGWRLFAIGAVAAAATTLGYLTIEHHYYLWIACCGGGALIAGGLWLRKI